MVENLGEINVKVKSEGVDDTADEVQDMSDGEIGDGDGGGPGEGESADMLGNVAENTSETSGGMLALAGGVGMAVGMLANLDGIKQMVSSFMKILQTLFMPLALMLMRALAPLIRVMTKLMPRIQKILDSKLGKIAGGLGALGGGILGGLVGGAPGAIIGAIFGSMIPIGVDMLMDHIFGEGKITKRDILNYFFRNQDENVDEMPGVGAGAEAGGTFGEEIGVSDQYWNPAAGPLNLLNFLWGGSGGSDDSGGVGVGAEGSAQNGSNVWVEIKGTIADWLNIKQKDPNVEGSR